MILIGSVSLTASWQVSGPSPPTRIPQHSQARCAIKSLPSLALLSRTSISIWATYTNPPHGIWQFHQPTIIELAINQFFIVADLKILLASTRHAINQTQALVRAKVMPPKTRICRNKAFCLHRIHLHCSQPRYNA